MNSDDILVQASGLQKSFGDVHAVNGVDLKIASGEIYGLVGSDGAGKTTTMRLLVGALLPPMEKRVSAGTVLRLRLSKPAPSWVISRSVFRFTKT